MDRRVASYLVAASLVLGAYLASTSYGLARVVLWQALLLVTVAAIVTGVRSHQPSAPWGWRWIATGIALMALSAASAADVAITAAHASVRPILELLIVLGYAFVGFGTVRFARAQSAGRDRGPVLDSLIVAIALTTVLWETAVGRPAGPVHDASSELAAILVVCVAASWVAAMTFRVHMAGGYRTVSGWLILTSAVLGCGGSAGLAGLAGQATFAGGIAAAPLTISLPWAGSLVTLGVAALHPSMVELTRSSDVEAAHVVSRTVLAAIALLIPPTAILVRYLSAGETAVVATFAAVLVTSIVIVRLVDLVRTREQALRLLRYRTHHDPLTELPNRLLLHDRLEHTLSRQPHQEHDVGVLFIDLDGFKAVNDAFGHTAGDDLLIEVATRMRSLCRTSDTLARLGGDEFVLVLGGTTAARALGVAARLLDEVRRPVRLEGTWVRIDASIGVALTSQVGRDSERLLSAADDAMYAAKRAGRGHAHLAEGLPPAPIDERRRRTRVVPS